MSPVDNTPHVYNCNFELRHSLKAFNSVPVTEYVSQKSGLTVCIAEVPGPVVHGYFTLVTEAFDDDGLPHTLEHLIFLGSENYPYKGVLDLLANRCLASGTNAWTDVDHTCYTMETAGSEGFCTLMPIFLEHILYPILSDEAFITEVHHITGEGEDAGVVYCEMQGKENSAESRMYLTMLRNLYPGRCGYSSETGGIMKNLRESTNNAKVRAYHKEFYRPENLKVIIVGQVNPQDVFKALEPLEHKIIMKGSRGPFQRPWQSPIPPLEASKDISIKYPSDEEDNGNYCIAWRGPSNVTELYSTLACTVLLKYLTDNSVSPLPKVFVEVEDPYASQVSFEVIQNPKSCLQLYFQNVPLAKMTSIKSKLQAELKRIYSEEDFDMKSLDTIINKLRLEWLSNFETNPYYSIALRTIDHMIYGNTDQDFQRRINPLEDLQKLSKENKKFWLELINKHLVNNTYISIECYPSKEEKEKMNNEEEQRIEAQKQALGEEGLKEKAELLAGAIEHNELKPPEDILTSVPIPSINSIKFHNILRYKTDSPQPDKLDLSGTSVFTYFDHIKTNFVYINCILNTASLDDNSRLLLPLFLRSLFELPIERNGSLVPYEQVVEQLNEDTICTDSSIGFSGKHSSDGQFSQFATVSLQLQTSKYKKGLEWLRELLYHTKFTTERIKIIAQKKSNSLSKSKRSALKVAYYAIKNLCYSKTSNVFANGMLLQSAILSNIIEMLNSDKAEEVLNMLENLRKTLTDPTNIVLHVASNLDQLEDVTTPLKTFLPRDNSLSQLNPLPIMPDYKFVNCEDETKPSCLIGFGSTESAFFYRTVKSINSFENKDLPALLLYAQYFQQAEGAMWKQIRGKGYAYGYAIYLDVPEGLLYLIFCRATNVVGAYEESQQIFRSQLKNKEWNNALLESAKSSLVYEFIQKEITVNKVANVSLLSYFQGIDFSFHRKLLQAIGEVTIEDLNRVGDKYIAPLFDSKGTKTVVVANNAKLQEVAESFKKIDVDLQVYTSLEESFLNGPDVKKRRFN